MKQFNSDSPCVVTEFSSKYITVINLNLKDSNHSDIFIMSLHIAPCLLCFFKFLCARVYLSSLCNAIRSSDRKGVQ